MRRGQQPNDACLLAGVVDIDPLDALIAELERIEGHETTLQSAIANSAAIVVHPRPEVRAVLGLSAPNTLTT